MHFTYDPQPDFSVLRQGDILGKTEQLQKLLEKYHAHYSRPEYTHFQILTQSCDLVRRSGDKCSARYITLAAVRDLDTAVKRMIEDEVDKKVEIQGDLYCSDKHKNRLASLLKTLFNNNSKEYFFLKASPSQKLYEDGCTFLYLSIAIKAHEHYQLCLNAKRLELVENFRAKLGWMVGNLYSRVGTEDYVPGALPDNKSFNRLIDNTLEKHIGWVPAKAFSEFKAAAGPGLSFAQVYQNAETALHQKYNQKVKALAGQLRKQASLTAEQASEIEKFLMTDKGAKYLP